MFVVCQVGVIVNNLVGGVLYGGRDSPNASSCTESQTLLIPQDIAFSRWITWIRFQGAPSSKLLIMIKDDDDDGGMITSPRAW